MQPVPSYFDYAVETVMQIHEHGAPGDILLFLTGQQEVDAAVEMLTDRAAAQSEGRGKRRDGRKGGKGGDGGQGGKGGRGADGGDSDGPEYNALLALPIYSNLPSRLQLRIFEPPPARTRKVVVATNIAETSLTVDGIVHVVDCGFSKQLYVQESGEEALVTAQISKASARQRAGRAGRSRPGSYYCLMTQPSFDALLEQTPPEMQRCALASTVLQLKGLGVENVLRFDYLSPPPPQILADAVEHLYALGALDESAALTQPRGASMAMLPLEPAVSCFLLAASKEGCEDDALSLAALLSLTPPFVKLKPAEQSAARARFAVEEGDALTLLNAYRAYRQRVQRQGERKAASWCKRCLLDERVLSRAAQVRRQLEQQLRSIERRREQSSAQQAPHTAEQRRSMHRARDDPGGVEDATPPVTAALCRALVSGYFANAARHEGGGMYRSVLRRSLLKLHALSVLNEEPPEWICFHETTHSGAMELILSATKVEERWLVELAPHFFSRKAAAKPQPAGRRGAVHGPTMPPAHATSTTLTMGAAAGGTKRARDDDPLENEEALAATSTSSACATSEPPGGSVAELLGRSIFGGSNLF